MSEMEMKEMPVAENTEDAFYEAMMGPETEPEIIARLNQELDWWRGKAKDAQDQLEASKKETASMKYRMEQAQENMCKQARKIVEINERHCKEVRKLRKELNAVTATQVQSVAKPCLVVAIMAVICLLIGLCVDNGWMVALLAELLISGFLCVASFFGGIVWQRLAENKNLRGQKHGGR